MFPVLTMSHFVSASHYDLWNTGKYSSLPIDHELYSSHVSSRSHQCIWVIILSFFIVIMGLNLYWYKIIMRGALKLIAGDVTGGADDDIGDGKTPVKNLRSNGKTNMKNGSYKNGSNGHTNSSNGNKT